MLSPLKSYNFDFIFGELISTEGNLLLKKSFYFYFNWSVLLIRLLTVFLPENPVFTIGVFINKLAKGEGWVILVCFKVFISIFL